MSIKTWNKQIARMLDELGIVYTFESGGKHTKIWMEKGEKKGMMVISASTANRRAFLNAKSTARRLVA